MVLKTLLYSLLSLFFLFACTQPDPQFEESPEGEVDFGPQQAKALYTMHCAACHRDDGKQDTSNAADLSTSKLSLQEIEQVIRYGNDKGMMPYKDIITSDAEVSGLAQYVQQLRK